MVGIHAEDTLTVRDMAGRSVQVPSRPDRIICLGPGTLRLIVYLGVQHKLVGIEGMEKNLPTGRPYWYANQALARLPVIGPGGPADINKDPDLEAVLSVKPQLIFVTQTGAGQGGGPPAKAVDSRRASFVREGRELRQRGVRFPPARREDHGRSRSGRKRSSLTRRGRERTSLAARARLPENARWSMREESASRAPMA